MIVTNLVRLFMALNNNIQQLGELTDTSWIRQAMFLPARGKNARTANFSRAQNYSFNNLVFEDTSLGGNRSINPLPQFTKFADLTLPSLLTKNVDTGNPGSAQSMGMGRYYNEIINANAQRIFLQFGIPTYNSLGNFLTTFYDPAYGNMTNNGVIGGSDLLYTISKYLSFITIWAVIPELALVNFLYGTSKKLIADLYRIPLSKFYYVKPTMFLYWSSVTTIVNALMVNMKLAQGVFPGDLNRNANSEVTMDKTTADTYTNEIKILNQILPDIFLDTTGGVDIRKVATRFQRLSDAHETAILTIKNSGIDEALIEAKLKAYLADPSLYWELKNPMNMKEYAKGYVDSVSGQGKYLIDNLIVEFFEGNVKGREASDVKDKPQVGFFDAIKHDTIQLWTGINQHLGEYYNFAKAEARDGGAFVSFIVDYEARVGESFDNRTKESDLASQMNETSRNVRDKMHDFANGNIGDGLISNTIETVIGAAQSVLSGIANSVGLSGLAILGGKAFVDVPEYWDSSTTTLPTSSYSIKLRSPYGNPISILTNIMVPLAMLLAGVAPRSTGKNSYAGPFLCKLWHQGYNQIQIGIIKDLTITRATSNIGRNLMFQPTGIDVSFSIVNLSKLLHVPIINELSDKDAFGITLFDEDNNFTDYMAILGGLGLAEQYYPSSRWRLRANKLAVNFRSYTSMENFLMWSIDSTIPGGVISALSGRGNI